MKQCQMCQLDFPDSVSFCRTCGSALMPALGTREEFVFCPHCGSAAKPTWRYCKRCGSETEDISLDAGPRDNLEPNQGLGKVTATPRGRLTAPVSRTANTHTAPFPRCPHCQTPLRQEARFCDICGVGVATKVASPPAQTGVMVAGNALPSTEKAAAPVTKSGGLKPGGQATPTVLEAVSLRPEERSPFKRVLFGAAVVAAVVAGVLLLRTWPSQPGTASPLTAATPSGAASSRGENRPKLFPASFSVVEIAKEDQYAGGHSHAVVKLGDQAVFMIRDEGHYHTTGDRARAITDNLRRALENANRDPQAEFRLEAGRQGPAIVQVTPNSGDGTKLLIVTVLNHDAAAYNRRSHRHVTARQLAEWWLNRLEDRFDLFVKGQRPTRTIRDEDGKLLVELFEKAKARSSDGPLTASVLYETLWQFSPQQRQLLAYEGVRRVPDSEEHH